MAMQPDKAKHPNTKALIERASKTCGLTQKEIAETCRVQQSIVSGWKSGRISARWEQVRPLIEKCGDVQGEMTSNIFCRVAENPYVLSEKAVKYLESRKGIFDFIEFDYIGMINKIKEIGTVRINSTYEAINFICQFKDNSGDKDEYEFKSKQLPDMLDNAFEYEYIKVYGELVYEYDFFRNDKNNEKNIWMKWSIVKSENSSLHWVISKPRTDIGISEIDFNHDDARMVSKIFENINSADLLEKTKNFQFDPKYQRFVHKDILIFSLISALCRFGYDLECVKTLGKQ